MSLQIIINGLATGSVYALIATGFSLIFTEEHSYPFISLNKNFAFSTISFIMLIAGCITYSAGILFYLKKGIPFGHGIFHLFIIGGTTCHFFAFFFLL